MLTGLPCWDLPLIPAADEPTPGALPDELAALAALFQQHGIAGGPPLPAEPAMIDIFELLLARTGAMLRRERLLILDRAGRCWAGGEQRDAASADYLRAQQQFAPVAALRARLEAWVARLPFDWLIARSSIAAAHRRWLQCCHAGHARGLPAGQEELLARIDSTTGATAWRRLYEDSAARVTAALAGSPAATPRSREHADREAETGWAGMSTVAAACLNAILGQEWLVAERRGWTSLLDLRLHHEGIPVGTLEQVHAARTALLADMHRFAGVKARLLGLGSLPYGEIGAVLPAEPCWTWEAAADLIIGALTECDPELGDLAVTAFGNGWIDAAPRPGKRETALCLPLHDGEARILVTFDGSAGSVLRLAHELGHAFHHVRQTGQTEWQRESPLVLRELAAMTAEQAIISAAFPSAADRIFLLGAWLARVFRTCVAGLARWRFEQEVAKRRRAGPLTEADLAAASARSQQVVYQAGIASGTAPRHTWISHPHLYTARFNSIPYVLARIAAAAAFPDANAPHLPPLLTSTGLVSPANLFARHGYDLSSPGFWAGGARAISAHVDRFAAAARIGARASAVAISGGHR